MPRLVPGRMKSLEEQCSALGFHQPCSVSSGSLNFSTGSRCFLRFLFLFFQDYNEDQVGDICERFKCLNGEGECEDSRQSASEGTICSDENDILPRVRKTFFLLIHSGNFSEFIEF